MTNYLKKKPQQNINNFRVQKIICSKLYKKEKKKFYYKFNLSEITDNNVFWKTITPLLYSKAPRSTTTNLTEKEAIIPDDQKVAETLSSFFEEAVDKLDIRGCNNILNTAGYSDAVEITTTKYENHQSTVAITDARLGFREVNLKDVEKEMVNINTEKAVATNSIPAKLLKETTICSPVFQQIQNE